MLFPRPENKKLLLVISLLLLLGGGFLLLNNFSKKTPGPAACTMEARQCPDGSYVGKSGPNCEFAACPQTTSLPQGYSLESYKVEKVLEIACAQNSDCQTPPEYMLISRCPMTSLCLKNKCTVVCPSYKNK